MKMLHYNFEGEIQVGELIMNERLADDILEIFQELFENQYQIQSMYLVDNYWTGDGIASDSASIDENNTSAFNYRQSVAGAELSNHANVITMGSQVIGINLAKELVREYLSVEWDPNCRSVDKVQRIIDFENEQQ